MSKLPMNSPKYLIEGVILTSKIITESDVVGSFYTQTEGILGDDLDFNFLYKKGKIGRFEIQVKKTPKVIKTYFSLPTDVSKVDTSLIAAACESVTKVGNTKAKIEILKISDKQLEKRKQVFSRAEELLKKIKGKVSDTTTLKTKINDRMLFKNVVEYVKGSVYGGNNVLKSSEVILVEGRSDVVRLIKEGYEHVLSFNGSIIDSRIFKLVKGKKIILFLDGDKSGKEFSEVLQNKLEVSKICFAPKGKEVEELNSKEIEYCLSKGKVIRKNTLDNKTKKIKKEKSFFYKNEFEKIEVLLPELESSSGFIVLSRNLRVLQKGLMSDILSTKLKNGYILLMNGMFEKSMNNKLNNSSFEVVITKRRSNLKEFNLKVFTIQEFKELSE